MSLELLLGPQLEAFAEAGYEIHTASGDDDHVAAVEAMGFTHHRLRHATRSFDVRRDVAALVELHRLCRRVGPDIVHTHNPKPGVYGRLAACAARVPAVVNTQHGLYAQPDDARRRRWPVYALERLAAACSDAELVQSVEDVATLRRLGVDPAKIHHLGNGVDLERFRPPTDDERRAVRAELGYTADDVVIGAVGRLVWEKGYAELFSAAADILAARPEARVVVVGPAEPVKGDPLTDDDIATAAAAGVRFLGSRRDVARLYWAFDAYVLASHREGFPRSAMEAAASGLPVVATDVRGCREVVDHRVNGLLVPVRSPRALATALSELVVDADLRAALGTAGRRRATEDFDQARVIERTLAVYDRVSGG